MTTVPCFQENMCEQATGKNILFIELFVSKKFMFFIFVDLTQQRNIFDGELFHNYDRFFPSNVIIFVWVKFMAICSYVYTRAD